MLWLHRRRFTCPDCQHRSGETSTTFGEHVQWTERLDHQVRAEFLGGCPGHELARRSGLSERTISIKDQRRQSSGWALQVRALTPGGRRGVRDGQGVRPDCEDKEWSLIASQASADGIGGPLWC
jgi:hypothetical protein